MSVRRTKRTLPDPEAGGGSAGELSVSQLTRLVKGLLETEPGLRGVWVRGELSNIRLAGSGHLYFTLKDEAAQLKCAWFGYSRGARKAPAEGSAALVHGDVRVYERNGEYQLVADDLLLGGTGDLAARFEALKARLAAEGLFDPARKRALPGVPRRIGIITSPSTAALQDVLNVLRRRAPYLSVVLFPATVQGEGASPEMLRALAAADAYPELDAVLLVRGGGSLEDLWCFNDEKLARAIVAMRRPVVSGVGHEIDFTIADFAADLRAPTPSAAAELIAPDIAELRGALDAQAQRLARQAGRSLDSAGAELMRLFDRRVLRDVLGALDAEAQTVDALAEELAQLAAERTGLAAAAGPETGQAAQLERLALPLLRRLDHFAHVLPRYADDLLRCGRVGLAQSASGIRDLSNALAGLDPRKPLQQGFALVWGPDGGLVRDAETVTPGTGLRVQVQRGEFEAERK
jgi:exodeoxyribonuclease VII large subunit